MCKEPVPSTYFQVVIDTHSTPPPVFFFFRVSVAKAGLELVILVGLVLLVICGPSPLLGLLARSKGISLSDSTVPTSDPAGCPSGTGNG